MMLSDPNGVLQTFHRTPWKFQQTFRTPLQDLPAFVKAILGANQLLSGGSIVIKQWVFEPKHLYELLKSHAIEPRNLLGQSLTASNPREVEELLVAAFSDWVDFLFVPTPKAFVIYADHDEFTTFFAHTRGDLNRAVQAMAALGVKTVPDFKRSL
jgi:hypothetical protein